MSESIVKSEITGCIWEVLVAPGDQVAAEDALLLIESMKMEIPVVTPVSGRVKSVNVSKNDMVNEGDDLIVIDGQTQAG